MKDDHYQRQLQPKLESRINQFRCVIKSDKVKQAQQKVEEVKGVMQNNVIEMSNNVVTMRDKLLPET